ncbi:hypothetical protein [Clostridium fungisolvens]|uniref:Uncharacterized protein n=1 Tax=Clostridium fungisolvens TaxID=1604897 RepID=A0A6V8SGB4_9CLOT|nr:hypothetical protein [Clostridium fungisolvens]GFP75515.1 hypothetical protein bsdtw1_01599 [Clostridium fungisolvens]
MNLIGKEVAHKIFGIGKIVAQAHEHFNVKFVNEEKRFQYPLAFEGFLVLLDDDLNQELLKEIAFIKDEIKKVAEETVKNNQNTKMSDTKKTGSYKKEHKQSKEMISIHKNCFNYLINYQKEHKDFYFIPRKVNNQNRLEEGYYFIGNEHYLMITFWYGGDGVEKIHNINFGITESEECYIEISSRDDENKAKYLRDVVRILEEKQHYKFDEIKENKWRLDYAKGLSYLEVLESFILIEKSIIDEYIKLNSGIGIEAANKEMDSKYVKRILDMQMHKDL